MKYHNLKNKILVNPNRGISRSQMVGINLIKICQLLISVRVPLKTLPNKGQVTISINNTKNNCNNNDIDNKSFSNDNS